MRGPRVALRQAGLRGWEQNLSGPHTPPIKILKINLLHILFQSKFYVEIATSSQIKILFHEQIVGLNAKS